MKAEPYITTRYHDINTLIIRTNMNVSGMAGQK